MQTLSEIIFENKCFCFTGVMAELPRKDAEKEVKFRNGLIATRMNTQVDYLVIGTVASLGWKFGDYGNKINEALALRDKFNSPIIISESDFYDGLSLSFPVKNYSNPEKILKISYEFWDIEEDVEIVKNCFTQIAKHFNFYIDIQNWHYNEFMIFNNSINSNIKELTIYNISLFNSFSQTDDLTELNQQIQSLLLPILKRPEKLKIIEFNEGTSKFSRFIKLMCL
jgi:hypothetical protein